MGVRNKMKVRDITIATRVMEKQDKIFGHLSCQLSISAKGTICKDVVEAVKIVSVAESNIKSCKRHLNNIKRQVKSKFSECASVHVWQMEHRKMHSKSGLQDLNM